MIVDIMGRFEPPTDGIVYSINERRPPRASDIDTPELLRQIHEVSAPRLAADTMGWVYTWEISDWYPHLPFKVIHAKLRRLITKGYLDGCPCGCRGDITVTPKGLDTIAPRR